MILVINDIADASLSYKILTVLDDNHSLCFTTHCHSAHCKWN